MGTLFSELWQADDNRIDENQYSYELQSSKRDFKNYTDLSAGRYDVCSYTIAEGIEG